jgi:hypothetical protein
MASFTDKSFQFNPYIQEVPIQEMVQVGMAKQAQYDQGVQKIQNQVDRVTGLNVLRPIEKQHLQSKLDELGSKLRTVAAGDFSNQQLVNSVSGMTGQIIKDPFIQAAVYSYGNDKKQLSEMEADEKKGKLTPQARYNYSRQREEFLNSNELADSTGKPLTFNGKYTASWDLEGALYDSIKSAGDGKWFVDNIFVTDPTTGQIKHDIRKVKDTKTGKIVEKDFGPIYSEYAVREIHEGRFPEAVKAAIDSVLNRPEAQTELGMRGVYNYRGYENVEDFIESYEKQKKETIALYNENKIELQGKILNEKDPEKKKLLEEMVNKIDNDTIALEKTTAEQEAAARQYKSLDAYKAALYSQQTRNNYMRIFNNATVSREFRDNPGWKAHQDAISDEFNRWKDTEALKVSKYNAETSRKEYNLKVEQWAADPKNANSVYNVPLEMPVSPHEQYANLLNTAGNAQSTFDSSKNELVQQYIALLNPSNTDSQVKRQIAAWEKAAPGFIDRSYEKAKDAILKNRNNVAYSNIVPLLNATQSNEKRLASVSRQMQSLNDEAFERSGKTGVNVEDLAKGLKSESATLTIPQLSGGPLMKSFTFTPKDILNAAIVEAYSGVIAGSTGNPSQRAMYENAKRNIESKFGVDVNTFRKLVRPASEGLISQYGPAPTGFLKTAPSSASKALGNIPNKINELVTKLVSSNASRLIQIKQDILAERGLGNSPLAYDLYTPGADEKTIKTIDRNLTNVLNSFKGAGIDVSKFEAYQAPSKDEKNKYSVNIGVDRTGAEPTFSLDLYDGKELVQTQPITYQQASYVTGRPLKVPANVSDVASVINWNSKKRNPTNSTNDITSNPFNASAYKGAYYTSSDLAIPGASNVVGADIFRDYNGGYSPYVYINEGGKVKAFPVKFTKDTDASSFPSADAAAELIRNLRSKAMVDDIIKNSK